MDNLFIVIRLLRVGLWIKEANLHLEKRGKWKFVDSRIEIGVARQLFSPSK